MGDKTMIVNKKMKMVLTVFVLTATLLFPAGALADSGCQFGELEMPLPGMEGCIDQVTLASFVNTLFEFAIAAIVLIGVILVVVGGYIYMTAGGDASRVSMAKSIIGGALLGIAIALASVVVLKFISPQFTNLEEPPLKFDSPDSSDPNTPNNPVTDPVFVP